MNIRLERLARQHLEALTALVPDEDARRHMRIPEPLAAAFAVETL